MAAAGGGAGVAAGAVGATGLPGCAPLKPETVNEGKSGRRRRSPLTGGPSVSNGTFSLLSTGESRPLRYGVSPVLPVGLAGLAATVDRVE